MKYPIRVPIIIDELIMKYGMPSSRESRQLSDISALTLNGFKLLITVIGINGRLARLRTDISDSPNCQTVGVPYFIFGSSIIIGTLIAMIGSSLRESMSAEPLVRVR